MSLPLLILVCSFVLFLMMNMPVAVAIGLSTFLTIMAVGNIPTETIIAQRMVTGIDSFALLAIPFFVLSGIIMGRGGIARRLINFAAALVGFLPGGLTYVNTLTCMLFGSISGSAAAAVSSVGGFMIPEMIRKGYGREFSVAVTATSATTGLLIPPSNVMIVYALVSGSVSIAALFMAGILPGIVVGLSLMVIGGIISVRRGYGGGERVKGKQLAKTFLDAGLGLLLVVIVLGGILLGIFTATEAAGIAVVYALILAVVVYKELQWRDLPQVLLEAGITTAVVMLLIGTSSAMSWILAYERVPQDVSASLLGLSNNPLVILLIINLLLLFVGTFMDMTPAVLIFTPIFLPVVTKLGVDPVHFGIVMIANLCVGICTPPVGTCLFLGCGVGKASIARVSVAMIPFFFAMFVALMLITYWPDLSLCLPRWLGLVK